MLWEIVIIGLIVALFGVEMWGIYRGQNHADPDDVDTITEVYRKYRDKLPNPLRYILMFLVTGLLFWTALHFFDLV